MVGSTQLFDYGRLTLFGAPLYQNGAIVNMKLSINTSGKIGNDMNPTGQSSFRVIGNSKGTFTFTVYALPAAEYVDIQTVINTQPPGSNGQLLVQPFNLNGDTGPAFTLSNLLVTTNDLDLAGQGEFATFNVQIQFGQYALL